MEKSVPLSEAIPLGDIGLAGLLVLSCIAVFLGLGNYGFINDNESLYVESAREMLLSGNLAIPTLNGLPYLEKPPLYDWLLVIAKTIFGSSEFAARSVNAVATLALVITTVRFSVLLGIESTGTTAGFILITSLGIDVMSRIAMPDMLLTALFSAACLNLLVAIQKQQRGYFRLCAALLGAAAMVKGPLPLALISLIGGVIFWFQTAWRKNILWLLRDPWAALLVVMPMVLWLATIEARQPGAVSYFIFHEQILRFLGMREPRDYYTGSVFYYIPRLFLFFFPWVGVLAFGWAASPTQDHDRRDVLLFLWACVWVPFGFFTLSSAKANYYIVLCLPPMALLTANYLSQLFHGRRQYQLTLAITVPVMVLVALVSYRAWAMATGGISPPPIYPMGDGSMPLAISALLVLTLLIVAMLQLGWRDLAIFCVGGLIAPILIQLGHVAGRMEPYVSEQTMATYIKDKFPSSPVFLYQDYENLSALPIYLERTIPVIDSKSADLDYGRRKFPKHPSFSSEERVLVNGRNALIVVKQDREQDFARTRLYSRAVPQIRIGNTRLYRIVE